MLLVLYYGFQILIFEPSGLQIPKDILFRRICNLPEMSMSICNASIVANSEVRNKKKAHHLASLL